MKNNRKSIYSLEELVGRTVKVNGVFGIEGLAKVIEVTKSTVVLENEEGLPKVRSYGSTIAVPRHVLPCNCITPVD